MVFASSPFSLTEQPLTVRRQHLLPSYIIGHSKKYDCQQKALNTETYI